MNKTEEAYNTLVKGFKHYMAKLKKNYQDWFDNLWETNSDRYQWYKLAKNLRPDLTPTEWNQAWQRRTILHKSKDEAQIELINAIIGWY